jgi:transposase
MHGHDKPIFFIVDNHPIHKSHKVKSFVESTNGRLYLFYLPPYSPDLNPDEMVWRHLKCHHIGKKFISSQKEMFRLVKNVLLSLQRTPRKIVGFYKKTYSGMTYCNIGCVLKILIYNNLASEALWPQILIN